MLSFLKGISPTKPFKATNLVFFLVAIQIVIKPGKENALEPLILSQSETGLQIFKQLLFSCLFRIPYRIEYASLCFTNLLEADCYVFRANKQ